jgi:16S rRNA (cytosine967-C5)-methyltransferase
VTSARALAADVLRRIDDEGAYANLALPAALGRSDLARRDRAFATELVYGVTRMRRACDFLVDRFLVRPVDARVRTALRLGAYQLHFLGTAPHAAVSATVALVAPRARGVVNAVLRRVAGAPVEWPDEPTRLSYPDWIVDRLGADLGADVAAAALEAMNQPAPPTRRSDDYIQDLASQWVADLVDGGRGALVADLCAGPGGKATALAGHGAVVAAGDPNRRRAGLVRGNAERLGQTDSVLVTVADGRRSAFRPGRFDRVLVDAPCSGLGTLRRRPDARWRATPDSVGRLGDLQRALVDAAVALLRPGGILVYSVCTLTAEETLAVDDHVGRLWPDLEPLDPPGEPWQPWGRGTLLLPQVAGTDGMGLFRYRLS